MTATSINFTKTLHLDKQAVIILLTEEQAKEKSLLHITGKIKAKVLEAIKSGQFKGENGEQFPLLIDGKLILLAGAGKEEGLSLTALRIIIRRALLSSFLKNISSLELLLHDSKEAAVSAAIEGCLIGTYIWKKHKTQNEKDKTAEKKTIFIVAEKKPHHEEIIKICEGVNLTRDLTNDNADIVTSDFLEKNIREIIKGKKNIQIEVLNKKELTAKGLNLHLAVNQGSTKEPKLIIVKYAGDAKDKNYTAIIGKGITFDTGGLNLKPSGSIETMRHDMAGAAAVIGTLKNTLSLASKKNIIFACAIAENAIGSRSYKPGDVIKSYAGKTVEIANTDAEGRLVLADAIAYVKKNYQPSKLIDIATLTGACSVALGNDYAAIVSTDDDLLKKLIISSKETDDRIWQLPNYAELKDSIRSQIADIKNLGFPKGVGGTITAAEFLRQFADGAKWAHLDIAGTAFVEGESRLYFGYGATGFGVRLLTHFLINS
ncbi:MAG: leucyl aminopeptidase [Candidatus Omnitrophica bacterium]|nr:leucyl aminopeptidase [Candidatus Omnitrophota bacterium]